MKLPKYRLLKQYNTIVTAFTVYSRTLYFLGGEEINNIIPYVM